jgi:hypothetical protein
MLVVADRVFWTSGLSRGHRSERSVEITRSPMTLALPRAEALGCATLASYEVIVDDRRASPNRWNKFIGNHIQDSLR